MPGEILNQNDPACLYQAIALNDGVGINGVRTTPLEWLVDHVTTCRQKASYDEKKASKACHNEEVIEMLRPLDGGTTRQTPPTQKTPCCWRP